MVIVGFRVLCAVSLQIIYAKIRRCWPYGPFVLRVVARPAKDNQEHGKTQGKHFVRCVFKSQGEVSCMFATVG